MWIKLPNQRSTSNISNKACSCLHHIGLEKFLLVFPIAWSPRKNSIAIGWILSWDVMCSCDGNVPLIKDLNTAFCLRLWIDFCAVYLVAIEAIKLWTGLIRISMLNLCAVYIELYSHKHAVTHIQWKLKQKSDISHAIIDIYISVYCLKSIVRLFIWNKVAKISTKFTHPMDLGFMISLISNETHHR